MLVKVCCIQDVSEAHRAAEAGASHIGLVGRMPSGPGPIPDEEIRRIAADSPSSVTPVLLTSERSARGIAAHVRRTGVSAVQLVHAADADVRREVRSLLPDLTVFQVVHVEGDEAADEAAYIEVDSADFVLLDSGRPSAPKPELGGTGRTHDWAVSRRIVEGVSLPVILAGGMRPENVREAITSVRPAGVDLCSGIRDHRGRLDDARLTDFMAAVRSVA